MLDRDIAVYFGTTTGNLNRAMKRNISRFPTNFCFQLTAEECSRFQIGILNGGRGSNLKYLPYAYTEQGVAMLTSVIHTDRAISASIQIMEAFVEMSHYIHHYRDMLPRDEILELSNKQYLLEGEVRDIKDKMVTKNDLSNLMKVFMDSVSDEELLILDGEPFKADKAYAKICRAARSSIVLIDDYIGLKTLYHLANVKSEVKITIISDNRSRPSLKRTELEDFRSENPGLSVDLRSSCGRVHDRFIVIDHDSKDCRIYHCGSSIKDSGNRITTVIPIKDIGLYSDMVSSLLSNPELILK
ncbi:MAG: ORF6N domain-containing protein [Candidatus Methanomethylophilaceae archaeon]|nr:ORF6N domain-containing protein [Candidatus Methanomethylophilaceae archaeon]